MARTARIQRQTAETDIDLELSLDGSGQADVKTGVGFLDHMLDAAGQARRRSTCASPPRAICTSTSTTRSKTSGICLGQALRAGPRRQGRHPPLRALHAADGRDAGDGRGRPERPLCAGVQRPPALAQDRRLRQRAARRLLASVGRPTACAICTCCCTTAATATTSPRRCSRRRPARCGWPSSTTRG